MRPDILDLLPDPKCWWRIHYQLYLCVALEFEAHTWQFWSTHEYYRSWKFQLQTPSTTLDRTWFVFWKKYFNPAIPVSSKKTTLIRLDTDHWTNRSLVNLASIVCIHPFTTSCAGIFTRQAVIRYQIAQYLPGKKILKSGENLEVAGFRKYRTQW